MKIFIYLIFKIFNMSKNYFYESYFLKLYLKASLTSDKGR